MKFPPMTVAQFGPNYHKAATGGLNTLGQNIKSPPPQVINKLTLTSQQKGQHLAVIGSNKEKATVKLLPFP